MTIDMKKIVFVCLFLFSSAFAKSPSKSYKVVCYLGSWANYRQGDGKFLIEDIDPALCTHLVYGFAKLADNQIAVYDRYLDLKENYGAFDRFNNLKEKRSGLKTLIAIGGWNEGSAKYSQMASSADSRKTFVDSCVQFLVKYKFDGLDLDWEYPANRGGKPEDKNNFVLLIKELREAFSPHGFLLTAAVSAGHQTIDTAYNIPAMGKYLDFINVMAYDFHGGWDTVTGHNAPLYTSANDSEANQKLNVDYAVKYWLSNGLPAEKLILGMPLYGRNFRLQDPKNNGLGAPISGNGMAGEYTNQAGMLGYNEICKILQNDKEFNVVFVPDIQAPYAVKGREWIGYDNAKSIAIKVMYLKKMKLGGAMIWSLETDDFRGKCHGQKFPLLRTIHDELNDGAVLPKFDPEEKVSEAPGISRKSSPAFDISSKIPTTASPPKSTANDGDLLPCPHRGYFRHPRDCKLFYFCQPKSSATSQNTYYLFRCSEGTVFSQELQVCTYPDSVPGCS